MGCNSHLAIEYKRWKDGNWDLWAKGLPESRDYLLYAVMANVRNYYDPSLKYFREPLGMPKDISPEGKEFMACEDYHSHTFISPVDFSRILLRVKLERKGVRTDNEWDIVERLLLDLDRVYGTDNVRLLVAFDN